MTLESYYGDALPYLRQAEHDLLDLARQYPIQETPEGLQPILYCKSRIKKPDSMMRKLKGRGLPIDAHTALTEMHDVVGMRIVCSFLDDVYQVSRWLHDRPEIQVIAQKDYIAYPKPNGYRSLHLIVQCHNLQIDGVTAEIQLRTIAIDSWAALEHQMKYKRHIAHEKTIQDELKRCADESASIDMSMQTIRDILRTDTWV